MPPPPLFTSTAPSLVPATSLKEKASTHALLSMCHTPSSVSNTPFNCTLIRQTLWKRMNGYEFGIRTSNKDRVVLISTFQDIQLTVQSCSFWTMRLHHYYSATDCQTHITSKGQKVLTNTVDFNTLELLFDGVFVGFLTCIQHLHNHFFTSPLFKSCVLATLCIWGTELQLARAYAALLIKIVNWKRCYQTPPDSFQIDESHQQNGCGSNSQCSTLKGYLFYFVLRRLIYYFPEYQLRRNHLRENKTKSMFLILGKDLSLASTPHLLLITYDMASLTFYRCKKSR